MSSDFSEFIDARLVGVRCNQAGSDAVLTFCKRSKLLEIRIILVERMLISDFTEQNVVDEIVLHARCSCSAALKERISELFFRCNADEANKEPSFIEKIYDTIKMIESGEKIFVEIIPVLGASALILGSKLEIL